MKTIPVLIAKKLQSGKSVYGIVAVEKPRENLARVAVRRELNTPGGHDKVDAVTLWLDFGIDTPVSPPSVRVVDSNDVSLLTDISDADRGKLVDWMNAEQLRSHDEGQVDVLVAADKGHVLVQFPRPIVYIKLPPESVRTLIERLQAELVIAEKEKDHAPETDGSADQTGQHDHSS